MLELIAQADRNSGKPTIFETRCVAWYAIGTPRTSVAVLVAAAIGAGADLRPKALDASFYKHAA
jgi:hypothetical protein